MCIKVFKLVSLIVALVFSIVSVAFASDDIRKTGDVFQVLLPLTAAGLTLYNSDTEGAIELSESLATTIAITYLLKYTINEKRPNGGDYSFPSGHASISFSSAEFMRQRYGSTVGIPAYFVASFVGYSRVESKEHYTKDVLAGALIGIVSSHFFTTPFQQCQINLTGDTRSISLAITTSF